MTATSADGRHVEADYSGDLVLEMEVPYLLKVADGHEWTHPFPVDLVSHDAVSRTLQDLRLGLMLSADQASPANVARTWLRFYEPLGHGGISWSDPRRAAQFTPTFLDWRQVRSWREWTLRVTTHRKSNIEVAIRRTLLAASERVDPADSLIDSVIAWENLVGSRQGESTLRVSAALAWLLGESLEDREAIRAQVSRLYSLRSQVVHGNRDLEAGDAIGPRAEALHLTLRTLRALFHERAFLLDESRDGTELGTRLIMGE